MNVCPICEASLSHHTLYIGNLVPAAYTMYHVFPCWQKEKKMAEKKGASPHRSWSRPMTRNQRLFRICFWPDHFASLLLCYFTNNFLLLGVVHQEVFAMPEYLLNMFPHIHVTSGCTGEQSERRALPGNVVITCTPMSLPSKWSAIVCTCKCLIAE